jgi:pimeloyl-ACP methyl ester carboxylesterase
MLFLIKHQLIKKSTFTAVSSYSTRAATVPLSFVKYDTYKTHKKPSNVQEKKQPLIICHGLFGSKQNWRSLAKSISVRCQCEVYTIVS